MSTSLVLHKGAKQIPRSILETIDAPPPEGRWFPLKHSTVLESVCSTLEASGYRVKREQLAVGRDGQRFFGTLDLDSSLAPGVSLAVGIRNSTDKSFPLGFCAGNRVFVCDNLAFRSELLVKRKHTRYGEVRFNNAIAGAVTNLQSFQEVEKHRIHWLQNTEVTEERASHLLVQAMDQGIVSAPIIPRIWKEVKNPSFDYGGIDGLSMWNVLQAFTTCLGERSKRSPSEYMGMTVRLNALFTPEIRLAA